MEKSSSNRSVVENVIRSRKTEKVTCDVDEHQGVPDEIAARNRDIVLRAIEAAGCAPFHYARNEDGLAEPWRVHVLWDSQVKSAAVYMRDE